MVDSPLGERSGLVLKSTDVGCNFFMEYVASGRLLPEINFSTDRSTREETAAEGEGHVPGFIVTHEISLWERPVLIVST